jgi:excisionase family DNA binding protein
MNRRPTQFGVRENTASPRRHASRLAVDTRTSAISIGEGNQVAPRPSPLNDRPVGDVQSPLHVTSQRAATGGNGEETVASFAEPAKTTAQPMGFEPLLDVAEAAGLLRIHPKTLRVKARRGVIPAIQIGRVWRFRASTLNRWLEKIAR